LSAGRTAGAGAAESKLVADKTEPAAEKSNSLREKPTFGELTNVKSGLVLKLSSY
jgi:hypothetical protein